MTSCCNLQVLVPVGALVGTFIAGWMVDRFGRKPSFMVFSVTCTIGWLLIILTVLTEGLIFRILIFIGRLFGGIGVGIASLCAPVSSYTNSYTEIVYIANHSITAS